MDMKLIIAKKWPITAVLDDCFVMILIRPYTLSASHPVMVDRSDDHLVKTIILLQIFAFKSIALSYHCSSDLYHQSTQMVTKKQAGSDVNFTAIMMNFI